MNRLTISTVLAASVSAPLFGCGADATETVAHKLQVDRKVEIGTSAYSGDLAELPDGSLVATYTAGPEVGGTQVVSVVNADGTLRWSHDLPHAGVAAGSYPGRLSLVKGQRIAVAYLWSQGAPSRCSYLWAEGSGTILSEVPNGVCPTLPFPYASASPLATEDGRLWFSRLDPDAPDPSWILSAIDQAGVVSRSPTTIGPANALAKSGTMIYAATTGAEDPASHELVAVDQSGQVAWRQPYQSNLFVQNMLAAADGLWISERNMDYTQGRVRHLDSVGVELWAASLGAGTLQFSIDPTGSVILAVWGLTTDEPAHWVQLDAATGAVLSEDNVKWLGAPTSVMISGQDDLWEQAFGTLYHYARI